MHSTSKTIGKCSLSVSVPIGLKTLARRRCAYGEVSNICREALLLQLARPEEKTINAYEIYINALKNDIVKKQAQLEQAQKEYEEVKLIKLSNLFSAFTPEMMRKHAAEGLKPTFLKQFSETMELQLITAKLEELLEAANPEAYKIYQQGRSYHDNTDNASRLIFAERVKDAI